MFFDKKKIFRGDKWGATYKHYLILDDTHPSNTRNLMEGYSKDQGTPEPHDKEYVLLKSIRLCLVWLQDGRALSATIIQRPDKTYNWQHATPILELGRSNYKVLAPDLVSNLVERNLKDLYEHMNQGREISNLPKNRSNKQGIAFTSQLEKHLELKTFNSEEKLVKYCRDKVEEGYEHGLLKNFYYQYRRKWFQS
jgi:hypothetical protein